MLGCGSLLSDRVVPWLLFGGVILLLGSLRAPSDLHAVSSASFDHHAVSAPLVDGIHAVSRNASSGRLPAVSASLVGGLQAVSKTAFAVPAPSILGGLHAVSLLGSLLALCSSVFVTRFSASCPNGVPLSVSASLFCVWSTRAWRLLNFTVSHNENRQNKRVLLKYSKYSYVSKVRNLCAP